MVINYVSRDLTELKRLQILCGQAHSARNAGVDVIALLKIDVLKEIAAYASGGYRIPIHVGSGKLRDRALYRHQSLAQVLVYTSFHLNRHSQGCSRGCVNRNRFAHYTQASVATIRGDEYYKPTPLSFSSFLYGVAGE
jgi:hypothetical protein